MTYYSIILLAKWVRVRLERIRTVSIMRSISELWSFKRNRKLKVKKTLRRRCFIWPLLCSTRMILMIRISMAATVID